MRVAEIKRETKETSISVRLVIDGEGRYDIDSGIGFMDHMLELMTRHGNFDIALKCAGDIQVDDHHSCEDIGIVLGRAFKEALGYKAGICRYGSQMLPMDEALVLTSLDISGRSFLDFSVDMPKPKVGTFDTELVEEFLTAFSREMGLTLHVRMFAGKNTHHIIEAVFKGLGRALRKACAIDPEAGNRVPSTKGSL